PEVRDLGELPLEHVAAASACLNGPEAEEAHAGGSFALELAIEVVPQALAARRREAGDQEVLQHRLLVSLGHVRGQFRLAAVLGLEESGLVEQDVAPRDARDAGRPSAGIALDPRLGSLVETELLDGLAIQVLRPARELEEHRVVRRDLVELFACEL